MRRPLFLFDTGEGGGAPDPAPAPAPAGDPAPEPPAGWQPTEEWGRRIDSFIEAAGPTLQTLNEMLYAEPEPEPIPGYNDGSFDPQVLPQVLPQLVGEVVQQQLQPFLPMFGQIAEQQGRQVAEQILTGLKSEIGDFSQDDAILLAQGFLAQGMEPEQAVRAAASHVHQREEALRQAAVEEFKKTLREQAGAHGEIGAGGAALEAPGTPSGPGRYEAAVKTFLERQRPQLP